MTLAARIFRAYLGTYILSLNSYLSLCNIIRRRVDNKYYTRAYRYIQRVEPYRTDGWPKTYYYCRIMCLW